MVLAMSLLMAACAVAQEEEVGKPTIEPAVVRPILPNLGEAPEISNQVWINADRPITLTSQQGNVVLLEFWTFG
jgi:hypothetical protein